ncbi:hypothetical protein JS87_24980 [Vibrio vulnificus]|nr:hypothetical protein JS87_24980 [Vibrio vulnificus]
MQREVLTNRLFDLAITKRLPELKDTWQTIKKSTKRRKTRRSLKNHAQTPGQGGVTIDEEKTFTCESFCAHSLGRSFHTYSLTNTCG